MGRLLNPQWRQGVGVGTSNVQPANVRPIRPGAAVAALPGLGIPRIEQAAIRVDNASGDSLRKLAFRAGLGMLFVMMAVLPELLASLLHTNTYLLYIVAPPAIFGAVFTGGLGRTLRHRPAQLWVGFFCFMALSVPFSTWKGDSVGALKGYAEFSLPLLFILAGLTVTFREVRSIFTTIGAAGLILITAAKFAATEDNGRLDMTSATGTIGNSNDLASHLVLVLPFLLFIALDRRRAAVIRFAMIPPAAYGLWLIFGTASRGAVIALAVSFVFVLFRAQAKQRIALIAVGLILAVAVPLMLRGNAADRLASMFGGQHEEALESQEARSYLLKQSLLYTMQYPLFGIGLAQFPNYEGRLSIEAGKVGNWHETHNSFTEVSSECGIPALIFFVLGIGSALFSVNRTYKKARQGGYSEIANACFCFLLSMVGFLVSITFLSNAYRFYLPAMIGLAIALTTTADREMSASQLPELVRAPGWSGPLSVRTRVRMAQP
jgi:putative inorganic carbon (HCO3(-)) transporter